MDALDECSNSEMPTSRKAVLHFMMDLVHLQLTNLHMSWLELNIQAKLKPFALHAILLHKESRQKSLIANYLSSVVYSDVYMKQWWDEDKKHVIDVLSQRADGV
jgi:hypothetical protein